MFRRFKNLLLLLLSMSIMISLVACSSSDKGEDTVTINPSDIKDRVKEKVVSLLPQEEQDQVMKKYYKLLTDKMAVDDIASFVDENIKGLDKENIETMIVSLEDYLSNNESSVDQDYSLLNQYKEHVSDEMKSYLTVIEREARSIFTDGEKLNVDISEIMARALEAEEHLERFPKGKVYNKIYDLYSGYIKGSILGAGNPYIFAEEGSTIIKKEYLDKYKKIIEENKDSRISDILIQYVELLEEENNDLNSIAVNNFYDKLDLLIEDSFLR